MEGIKKVKRLKTISMTSDEIFDMDVRYNPKKFNKEEGKPYKLYDKPKLDPPYRGKGYRDVAGSLATYKDVGERPADNAGRKSNTYRANRSKFNGHSILFNGFNDDSGVKPGPVRDIKLNRSSRWKDADNYVNARVLSPSNLKVI